MITKIEVDGFKSLSGFTLKLKPGLNILVGPNGGGKTNIVQFFEFVSQLKNSRLGDAISNMGGVGYIFRKTAPKKYESKIRFKVIGSVSCQTVIDENSVTEPHYIDIDESFINYEYKVEITRTPNQEKVYYSNQSLKFAIGSTFVSDPDDSEVEKMNWIFKIASKNTLESPSFNVEKLDSRALKELSGFHFLGSQEHLEQSCRGEKLLYYSLIECLSPMIDGPLLSLRRDLAFKAYNFEPNKIKELEDSAKPPRIDKNGIGLSATLNSLQKSINSSFPAYLFWDHSDGIQYKLHSNNLVLGTIIQLMKSANRSIDSIDVVTDSYDSKLKVMMGIKSGIYESNLPLSAMSDGTIKWLALVTTVLTQAGAYSIEEPENFLHPWMQNEIVRLMRDQLVSNESFVLLTTHSESLINSSEPEEIILVDLLNGVTTAKRVSNIDKIKEQISETSFGLGFFYTSGSLEND